MKAIVVVNNKLAIGANNKLIWNCPEDLKLFRKLTTEKINGREPRLLVGFNTFVNLPILGDREVILDKRNEFILDVDWVIGGAKTYEKYKDYINEWHVSYIDNNSEGDTYFNKELLKNKLVHEYYFR